MDLTLEQMRNEVRRHCGTDADDEDFDDVSCNQYINFSWQALKTRLKLSNLETTYDVASQTGISFTGSNKYVITSYNPGQQKPYGIIGVLYKKKTETQYIELKPVTIKTYGLIMNYDEETFGVPAYYSSTSGLSINLAPGSAEEFDLRVVAILEPFDLDDVSTPYASVGQAKQIYEIIIYGAVWRAHIKTNFYEKADAIQALQDKLISEYVPIEAITERDSKYAQLNVILPSYNPRGY